MNNSDLATATPSEGAFVTPRAHPRLIPRGRSADEPIQGDASVAYLETVSNDHAEPDREAAKNARRFESWTRAVGDRPDWGLWLLGNSTLRHHRWNRLFEYDPVDLGERSRSDGLSETLKRTCDLVGSLFLLALSLPLFPLLGLAIKLDSPGPVFFRHYRIGRHGERFVLWKFRSMKVDVSQYSNSPRTVTDIRLTRVGRLIRRLSIDELPQLINVVRGEMSLVGPRPEMPFLVDQFHQSDSERLTVRPGITGLWQISPARASQIHENLQYDIHYIRNQNLVLDCAILLRTIAAVIHGVGAV
jgi:lipopolysaccharide/colanic/teichoic acid biosynthesis glycosyltransferase